MRLSKTWLAKGAAVALASLTGVVMAATLAAMPAMAVDGGGAGISGTAGGGGATTTTLRSWWQGGNADPNKMKARDLVNEGVKGSGTQNWEARNNFGTIFSNWGNLGPTTRAKYSHIVDDAVRDCQRRGKCSNPRVALMGVVQIPKGKGYGGDGFHTANGAAWMPADRSDIPLDHVPNKNMTWTVKGRRVNLDTKLKSGKTIRQLANAQIKSRTTLVAVVLSDEDIQQQGWMPKVGTYHAYDVKTTSTQDKPESFTGIAEYAVHAEGYDGYVKGMSTKPKSYQTPFGSLVAALNAGKNEWNWNAAYGTGTCSYKGLNSVEVMGNRKDDPSGAVRDANKNIRAAIKCALEQTDKMNIEFKISDAPGVDGQTGKDINEAFKKGGQYKLVKTRKLQTVTLKGMTVKYHRRPVDGKYFIEWVKCTKEKDGANCGYIGKQKPKNAPSWANIWISWLGKWGSVENRGKWEELKDGPGRTFYIDAVQHNKKWGNRRFWTVQAARAKDGQGDLTLGRMQPNGKMAWVDPNKFEREAYAGSDDWSWISTNHFKPAPNFMQSPVVVALQDFAHMNCNKADFDKYVDYVRSLKTPQGDTLLDEGSVKSTKYDGYFNTKLVTDPNPVNVKQQLGSMTTVLLRQPGNTVFKAGDKLTNGKEPTLANWQIQWGSTTWNTPGKNSGQIDPTYTKECPFDCVADASVVRSNIRKGVANDPNAPGDTRTSNDILTKDAYGVQVWPNKNGQDPDLNGPYKANTSHMQFFRNNEWNYFTVDRWAPASTDGIRYDGGDAKSTTIVRNADGTPWMANGTRLTNMDANAGGWKPLFNGNGNVVNQWSSSTNDRFDTNTSNQIGGQATQFRIKSAWATENGKPLKFNVKWEYEVDNTVRTPTVWKIRNNGTNLDTVSVTTVDQTTKVDGKCDSQFNRAGQVYQDHTDYAQQGTGVTRKNTQDVNFEEDNPMKGWFSITFVRATSE